MGIIGRADAPLVEPSPMSGTDSPSRKLTLLGSVLFCGAACATRTTPGSGGVSAPTPRRLTAPPRRLISPPRSGSPPRATGPAEDGPQDDQQNPAFHGSCCAPLRVHAVSPTPPQAGGDEETQDWFDASSSVHREPSSVAAIASACAAEVSPDVLCPSHNGCLQIYEEYEFLAGIGVGAFGRVLKVQHRGSGQSRACKCLSAVSQLERGLVDTEVEVLKSLNHPHVVRLHEVFIEPGNEQCRKFYLITELLEGGDVLFRIHHHYQTLCVPMKEGHVAYMMRQILSAVMYCHHRGVVHRDVKPDNILFVDAGAASPLKIIDFGLAGFAERLRDSAREVSVPRTPSLARLAKLLPAAGARWCHVRKQMMQRAGTAFYMAPEMIQVGRYDQKADMFSIGAILSELLTGWHPFYTPEVDDTESVHAKITAPGAVRLPRQTFANTSREAVDLCQRLLEKDPRRRLSAGQALAHPWFRDPSKPTPYGNLDTGALTAETFVALRRFRASNKVRRAALLILAWDCAEAQVREIRDAFQALDLHGDGLLSPEELREGARRVECALDDGEAEALVAIVGGASGRAGYKEFMAALLEHHVQIDDLMLQRCFRKFDADGKGYITFEDVDRVLVRRGAADAKSKLSSSEWLEICAPKSGMGSVSDAVLKFSRFSAVVRAPEHALDVLASRGALLADEDDGESLESSSLEETTDLQAHGTMSEAPNPACPLCALSPMAPG
mmetsp:Transcript_138448/g.442500  ORF Transcript_138448/g.442500 Transcript_138448/m.442500 type:complete len:726 (-) Transcript_138448:463-2640(-)